MNGVWRRMCGKSTRAGEKLRWGCLRCIPDQKLILEDHCTVPDCNIFDHALAFTVSRPQ
ncbi:hypothetical protein MPTK1_6g01350 [Marchantia polymorpha subsp. ruderalis]|uniref:Uncharacterized protein n=2 Tax=Marchantia polymorpha TaxID=3197 RepID=A0AAF6BMC8_MARPO|nr:hypothetical protein MARPO_0052s0069 [Marchantia polymorpha]BBN13162.1 hypothetical protein Mp_6g01350 [Marchantia polymorpha subsp. ruderalis]|eukprot:PTQ38285.1 hypothetical protein MARPO_0052s0069 [Marchantia polymorpha]